MSKEIALKDYAALAVSEDISTIIAEAAGPSGIDPQTDLDRVHIPAGGGQVWEIPTLEGSDAAKEIEGVIVHHNQARAYWRQSFEESGGGTPPDCSSRDGYDGIGDPGGDCAKCPFAQFGSGNEETNSQACKQMTIVYMMRPDSILPMAVALPPTSIKPARAYLLRLASRGIRPHEVVTRIKLESAQSGSGIKYSKASFEMAGRVDKKDAEKMGAYAKSLKPVLGAYVIAQSEVA
jgi:hypothetical protein